MGPESSDDSSYRICAKCGNHVPAWAPECPSCKPQETLRLADSVTYDGRHMREVVEDEDFDYERFVREELRRRGTTLCGLPVGLWILLFGALVALIVVMVAMSRLGGAEPPSAMLRRESFSCQRPA
jgi:hypothetical protein